MQWNIILIAFVIIGLLCTGLFMLSRFLKRRRLKAGSPWGYYAGSLPSKEAPGFSAERTESFLHNTAVGFGGNTEGFGDLGQFSGFGELGEYGQGFNGSGQE